MGDPFAHFMLDILSGEMSGEMTKDIVRCFLFVFDGSCPADKISPSDREIFLKADSIGIRLMIADLEARGLICSDKVNGTWPLVRLLRKRIEEDPGSACLAGTLKVCEDYNEMRGIAEP